MRLKSMANCGEPAMESDVIVFGGGAAGLWLMAVLQQHGLGGILLECNRLGEGQTIASQGIIHSGLKYSLNGLLSRSARSLAAMPGIWRACLSGRDRPDLSRTRIRSEACYVWGTGSTLSRLGLAGARIGLRARPKPLAAGESPCLFDDMLAARGGSIMRLDEQVISPPSFIANLFDQQRDRILKIDADDGLEFSLEGRGRVRSVRLRDSETGRELTLCSRHVVFTAGSGNRDLRLRVGLAGEVMQRRPLQMVLARGPLPPLNGHCVEGARTRLTITSDRDSAGRTVWQIGGQIAEVGASLDPESLMRHASSEVEAVLPGIDLSEAEWANYRIDRAEGKTRFGRRPHGVQVLREGNTITAWPTKLALVPKLTEEILRLIGPGSGSRLDPPPELAAWPRPPVAQPPWEGCRWTRLDSVKQRA